jgi:hypothetical protein
MISFTRTSRVVGLTAAAALVAGAGVFAASTANAATTAPSAATSASSSAASTKATGLPFRAIRPEAVRLLTGDVPAALTADVKALKGKTGDARRTAVRSIEAKALTGGYGASVKSLAVNARNAWTSAPASLEADLKALRGKDATDRKSALNAIERKALAGDYGDTVKKEAEALRDQASKTAATKAGPVIGSIL